MSIPRRSLGRTGLQVSSLALGTVALGMAYGIQRPGGGQPTVGEAIELIRAAVAAGINLFDTAPGYGAAEQRLGEALAGLDGVYIATKLSVAGGWADGERLRREVWSSIDNSRRALRRDRLDILQLHNPTVEMLASDELSEILQTVRQQGLVGYLGASVYTEAEALAAIATGWIEVVQVPYNLLDQRMAVWVWAAAAAAGVGILTRSVYLKGVLTERSTWLPPELMAVRQAGERVRERFAVSWSEMAQIALRFCLSEARISSVLIGPSALDELEQSLCAVQAGPLDSAMLVAAAELAVVDPALVDPRQWSIL